MQQTALFHDDVFDALAEAIRHLGGYKKVGVNLRPEMSAEAAGNWLRDCISPGRREKLGLDQMMLILRAARQVGFHGAMDYITGECGYGHAQPIEPQDEMAELRRRFIDSVAEQKQLIDRFERLTQSPLQAVK